MILQFKTKESRMGLAGVDETGNGSYCLMGTEKKKAILVRRPGLCSQSWLLQPVTLLSSGEI